MSIYRAPTAFLTKVKAGSIRSSGVLLTCDTPTGAAEQFSLPLPSIDDTGRVINLGGAVSSGGRPANATVAVEVDARMINLNRECACDATPDLVPRLVALGFTAYAPAGGSTAYVMPQAA